MKPTSRNNDHLRSDDIHTSTHTSTHTPFPLIDSVHPVGWAEWKLVLKLPPILLHIYYYNMTGRRYVTRVSNSSPSFLDCTLLLQAIRALSAGREKLDKWTFAHVLADTAENLCRFFFCKHKRSKGSLLIDSQAVCLDVMGGNYMQEYVSFEIIWRRLFADDRGTAWPPIWGPGEATL